uniref:Uncharacterized protein n=1 Tax=Panagrolaimus sp. ES5 TaxID=591445 RepID=A0AC34GAQ9_9BILA
MSLTIKFFQGELTFDAASDLSSISRDFGIGRSTLNIDRIYFAAYEADHAAEVEGRRPAVSASGLPFEGGRALPGFILTHFFAIEGGGIEAATKSFAGLAFGGGRALPRFIFAHSFAIEEGGIEAATKLFAGD